MTNSKFTTHKYNPLQQHSLAFQRPYLESLLNRHFDIPLMVIEAPVGYGKTTLLSSLAYRSKVNTKWLSLDKDDVNFNICVSNICNTFYGSTIPIEISDNNFTTAQAAQLIIGAFRELSIDTLILDNYEIVLESESVNTLLEQVVIQLPPLKQIIVASNKALPFKRSARLRSRIAEINSTDMEFDVDDIVKYFDLVAYYKLNSADANLILRHTQGQPVLINLLVQLAYGLQPYLRIDFNSLLFSSKTNFLIYLLREVLSRLSYPLDKIIQGLKDLNSSYQNTEEIREDTKLVLEKLANRYCLVHRVQEINNVVVPHSILLESAKLI